MLPARCSGDRSANYLYCLDFLSHRNLLGNRTKADGLFVWENAPDDVLSYQIYGPGYLAVHYLEFGPEGSPHTLVFRRRIPVELTVLDAATGERVTEFRLYEGTHFKSNSPGFWQWHLRTRQQMRPVAGSWAEGDETAGRAALELANLDDLVQYRVQADGYRPAASPVLDAAALPDEPVNVEIRLEKNSGYDGRVLQADGTAAASATLYVKTKRSGEYDFLTVTNGVVDASQATVFVSCDAEGRFPLPPIDDPFVCFVADETGYRELTDAALYGTDAVTLQRWSRLEGNVHVGGMPAADLQVTMNQSAWAEGMFPAVQYLNQGQTDASGHYAFARCVAGSQWLSVFYDAGRQPGGQGVHEQRYFELVAE